MSVFIFFLGFKRTVLNHRKEYFYTFFFFVKTSLNTETCILPELTSDFLFFLFYYYFFLFFIFFNECMRLTNIAIKRIFIMHCFAILC